MVFWSLQRTDEKTKEDIPNVTTNNINKNEKAFITYSIYAYFN